MLTLVDSLDEVEILNIPQEQQNAAIMQVKVQMKAPFLPGEYPY